MFDDLLPSDHNHISETRKVDIQANADIAIDCKNAGSVASPIGPVRSDMLTASVADFIKNSIAENTRRANQFDLAHFEAWGGRIPSAPELVASYLAEHAGVLAVSTLVRRVATISKAHEARGLPNPCRSEIVRATLRGIKRTCGVAQRQAKPLLKEDLFQVLDGMSNGIRDARDRALLLIGFAGGFRRSELVGLDLGVASFIAHLHDWKQVEIDFVQRRSNPAVGLTGVGMDRRRDDAELFSEQALGDLAEALVRVPFHPKLKVLRRAPHAHEEHRAFLTHPPARRIAQQRAPDARVGVMIDVERAERSPVGERTAH
jgi:hypothetical protein